MSKLQAKIKKDHTYNGFKKMSNTQYEKITPKYDFYITVSDGVWAVSVFNHKIRDTKKAHIEDFEVASLSDGIKQLKKYR